MNDPYGKRLSKAWGRARKRRDLDAPKVVSTFAGGGGSSMGYKMAGYDVRVAIELSPYPAASYRLNFPETIVREGDIADVSVEEALDLAAVQPGELDVFDGSPPCQGFSTAGKRNLTDPRNSLFKEYVRLLRGLRPKAFVMENVSGMVKGKMLWVFRLVMQELRDSGYVVSCRLLNAKWFGVPQSRQRVIILGIRNDLGAHPEHPRPQESIVSVEDACPWLGSVGSLRGEVASGSNWQPYNKVFEVKSEPVNTIPKTAGADLMAQQRQAHERSEFIPAPPLSGAHLGVALKMLPGQSGPDVHGGRRVYFNHAMVNVEKPAPTITRTPIGGGCLWFRETHGSGLPGGGLLQEARADLGHPRSLSIGEVMRLCSFPDEYQFPEVASAKRKRWENAWGVCGNSVPPLMMEAVALKVRETLGV